MAATMNAHTELLVDVAGITAEVRRGGSGAPLLVIHGELGVPGWLEAYRRLSESFEVIVPSLPGYGRSTRPDWIMGARDLAAWIAWFARDSRIPTPMNVIGCSMGGWVAAEIATVAPQFIDKLVLVGAMGVKPQAGEIFDYFLESGRTGLRRAFHRPDQAREYAQFYGQEWTQETIDRVEQHREMTCRVAWKPYMHSLTLPYLLPGIPTPTLIVWGRNDAIVPLESGEAYQRAIKGSRLAVIDDCGHMPEMEKPAEFAQLVRAFLTA
ncbi:MAG TPA: alpha/beta hydrolase [Stellaceae bacterium]|nr:alpha/beta hydrolase [Stellaceae bacterium]